MTARHLLLLLGLTGLAPVAVHAQDTTRAAPPPKRNPDVISAQEITEVLGSIQTAYELVDRLRPLWLKARGRSSITLATPEVQIYVGGVKMGGPSTLQNVPLNSVREVRHLRGTDASQRFGDGHESGAVLVIL